MIRIGIFGPYGLIFRALDAILPIRVKVRELEGRLETLQTAIVKKMYDERLNGLEPQTLKDQIDELRQVIWKEG